MKHFMEERAEQLLTHRNFTVWDGNFESDDMISTVAKLTCIFAVFVDFHGIGDEFTNKVNEEGSVENWKESQYHHFRFCFGLYWWDGQSQDTHLAVTESGFDLCLGIIPESFERNLPQYFPWIASGRSSSILG